MTAQPKHAWTVEAYLAFERESERKHEYFSGEIFAMAGASVAHNIITANIVASLHRHVLNRPCTVFPSDMRLKVVRYNLYTYPDVMVICGDIQYDEPHQDVVLNPIILIEVLSPSTENYDRGKKAQYYRTIPSLREYLLVAQDSQHIEHFTRHAEHQWLFSDLTSDDATFQLATLDCTVGMAEIYHKVPWPPKA